MKKKSYSRYEQFLTVLAEMNCRLTVVNQRDLLGRFYCSFIGFPIVNCTHYIQDIYVADCCHSKAKEYDGITFNLMSKTGHRRMIILCVATIPAEDSNHLFWVLQLCVKHGVCFKIKPLFSDQGPLIAAAKMLS